MEIKVLTARDGALWEAVAAYAQACSWETTGPHLAARMTARAFSDRERVLAAFENGAVAGFCALTETCALPDLPYTPFLGFVFVGEAHRGRRLSQSLCRAAADCAKALGFDAVYLYSDLSNFYEKYGFVKIGEQEAPWGIRQSIYRYDTRSGREAAMQDISAFLKAFADENAREGASGDYDFSLAATCAPPDIAAVMKDRLKLRAGDAVGLVRLEDWENQLFTKYPDKEKGWLGRVPAGIDLHGRTAKQHLIHHIRRFFGSDAFTVYRMQVDTGDYYACSEEEYLFHTGHDAALYRLSFQVHD